MMRDLVESIAKALVDHPEQVLVNAVEGEQVTVLELRVAADDMGKVIGRQGRTAKSIRTLLGAAGMKLKKRYTLEILEERGDSSTGGHHSGTHPAPAWAAGRSGCRNPHRFSRAAQAPEIRRII
jgi:predicted RNA-binding protein YlqC (UPF0109 family)